MINRTRIKDSIYDILNEDPKKIKEYQEKENKKTPEQKIEEQKKYNKKSHLEKINLQENINNQEDNPYNRVVVHTEKDNLIHNYFHYFDMYWDAGDVISSVILKLPKTDVKNTQYWITYTGYITIYLGNEVNTETHKSKPTDTPNTYWSLKGMQPIFKGEIGIIKEYSKELEIHIDSIGKRFKQKIPEEFRQSFIYNQNVRDAFQAICEFLGVKYICPPKTANDTTDSTKTLTDGTQNNVNKKTQQESQLATSASTVADTDNSNSSSDQVSDDDKKTPQQKRKEQKAKDKAQNNQAQNNLNNSTQQNDVQNGYADISFDANGGIVHGSSSIITSPDMEDTLLELEEHPLDKYLKDTTYIATDVKKFLNGEMFDELHNSVMNYDAITIQAKSASTSNISAVGGNVGATTNKTNSNNNKGLDIGEAEHVGLKGITFVPNTRKIINPIGNTGSSGTMFK